MEMRGDGHDAMVQYLSVEHIGKTVPVSRHPGETHTQGTLLSDKRFIISAIDY